MIEVISSTIQKAKKKYYDDGYDYILNWIDEGCYVEKSYRCKYNKVEFADYRTLVKWKNDPNNNYIMPGMLYERQLNKMDGKVYTFRMRKEMAEMAQKYDLFNDY